LWIAQSLAAKEILSLAKNMVDRAKFMLTIIDIIDRMGQCHGRGNRGVDVNIDRIDEPLAHLTLKPQQKIPENFEAEPMLGFLETDLEKRNQK
jgi:hypothetical protein